MDLFHIQLITSFLVGGSLIALLSIISERIPEKIAGVVLMLPSTLALSYLFISWSIGSDQIPYAVPPTLMTMGTVMVFLTIYLYLSKIKLTKIKSILLSLIGGVSFWLLINLPLTILEINKGWVFAFAGFFIGTLFAIFFVTRKTHTKSKLTAITYTWPQKVFRAFFAGAIITLAVYLAKTLGPMWGGVFGSYPAVFTSTLTMLHWHYDSAFLFRTFKFAPLANFAFLIFIFASIYTFPAWGTLGGFFGAYLISLPAYILLAKITSCFSESH